MKFFLFFIIIFFSKFAFAEFKPQHHILENGLEIVVLENNRIPAVAHSIWYKVGSADEPNGKSGIAHFLEHLMFKGTDKLKPGEFSQIVSINGGKENAFTSKNYTGYFQLIHKSKLELIMSLEADRMKNIKLLEKEFENEKTVVLEERYSRVDDNPSALLSEQINAALYMNHPYRKPIIGWEHEIKNLNLDDVMKFYEKYYAPNNAIIVICGDINLDEVVKIAKKYFGVIKPSKIDKRSWTLEPTQHAPRKITLKSKDTAIPVFKRHYLVPTYTKSKKESLTLEVFSEIFGNPSTGILFEEFVKNKKLAIALGVIALTACLPRLKSYNLMVVIPSIFFLINFLKFKISSISNTYIKFAFLFLLICWTSPYAPLSLMFILIFLFFIDLKLNFLRWKKNL